MNKKLNIISTNFKDLYLVEPNSFKDERGTFSRVFCEDELKDIFKFNIKQINHSITKEKGTFRGLHFQYEPNAEIKMVKCIKGAVIDIVVDIRENSPTFLQHFSVELTEQNQKMIYIPKGFAHGFQTLKNNTELLYFHSSIYTPSNEGALNIFDKKLNIVLPLDIINLSNKDKSNRFLTDKFKGVKIDEL
ncbi:dTDP-4-dehydrorhamnose 3,5-epimerase family protein [Aliarcobacter lanthieri]|uniref:dTDP-4-dehydrorhamnose 3,5-epimerase family protein n=1 Tax=Aliarcobacter lanthieri TaxID=1355374 RepID=UPI003AABB283